MDESTALRQKMR